MNEEERTLPVTEETKKEFVLENNQDFSFEPAPEMDEKTAKRLAKKRRRKNNRGAAWLYVCVVMIVCVLLALGSFLLVRDSLALMKPSTDLEIEFEVPMGATQREIADMLEKYDVIDYPICFRLYMKFFASDTVLQHGSFVLHPGMSYEAVKEALSEVQIRETVTVTIPEGWSLSKIARTLMTEEVIEDDDAFIDYVNSHMDDLLGDKKNLVPIDAARFYQAEGFLFPDTYEFYKNSSNASAAAKMVNRFLEVVDAHWAEIESGMKKTGLNFVEMVTLASVIQGESSHEEHMADVSGVFYNRLTHPLSYPKLESDPTRDYANDVIAERSLVPVQKMMDSYDTYTCVGVPAGPINSPGEAAILAAANPAIHEYYFFVSDDEGKFYFSKTYEEHQRICWKLGYYGA